MGKLATIKDVDHGFRDLLKSVISVRGHVRVGVDDRPHEPSGQPTDEIGAAHEFGTATVPKRSFLRGWIDTNKAAIQQMLKAGAQEVASGRVTWAQFQSQIGGAAVEAIRHRMLEGLSPELEPETLRRRVVGSTPLVDTHQLIDALTHEPGK